MSHPSDQSKLKRARRTATLIAVLALVGCGRGGDDAGKPDETLACRAAGKPTFETVCKLDRTDSPDGTVLTVRWPDGAFRRLLMVRDGRGIIAADGAEPVQVAIGEGSTIDLTTAEGQVRMPARIVP